MSEHIIEVYKRRIACTRQLRAFCNYARAVRQHATLGMPCPWWIEAHMWRAACERMRLEGR